MSEYIPYEQQYLDNLQKILDTGVFEANARTGVETYRLPFTQIQVDVSKEIPILTSKNINWKSAIKEMIWIYLQGSNVVSDLDSHIWDKFEWPDGTIGKSYGYQAGKHVTAVINGKLAGFKNQLDYVIGALKADKSNRQAVISLWSAEELHEMSLPPCIVSTIWSVIDGKLNCLLTQRSGDYPLGVPFDTFEHAVLMLIIAHELGVQPGILTHVIGDSHVYKNQAETVKTWLSNVKTYPKDNLVLTFDKDKKYSDLTIADFDLVNYEHGPDLKFPLN